MIKFLERFVNVHNSQTEPCLLKKIKEGIVIGIVLLMILIGALISLLITKSEVSSKIAAMAGILLCLSIVVFGRYAYYYYFGHFKVVVGTCIDVNYSTVKKVMNFDSEVFIQDENNILYRFHYPFKKTLFKKENKLKIIVPEIYDLYKKEGYIQLTNIILVDREDNDA